MISEFPKITKHPGSETRKYYELARKYSGQESFFSGYRHPVVHSKGYGSLVEDVDGNVFLDMSMLDPILGHCQSEVVETVSSQMKKLTQLEGKLNVPAIKLAEKLVKISPGNFPKKAQFGIGGSDSVELAMKLTRYYTGRQSFISFLGAFHGRTIGSSALTSEIHKKIGFPRVGFDVVRFPYPYCYRCPFGKEYPDCDMYCLRYIGELFKSRSYGIRDPETGRNDAAAVFFEPIEGNAGNIVPPNEFMPGLRKLCDKYDIPLVADEILTGVCRTGKIFCSEHYGVAPDVIVLAKPFGGGLWPLGGVIAREEYFKGVRHLVTFSENPLGCAAGLAVIDIIEKDHLCERASKMGEHFLKGLEDLKEGHEMVGRVQGKGLMLAMEFVKDEKSREPAPDETQKVIDKAISKGLIVYMHSIFGNTLNLFPALTVTKEQLDKTLEILDECISEVSRMD